MTREIDTELAAASAHQTNLRANDAEASLAAAMQLVKRRHTELIATGQKAQAAALREYVTKRLLSLANAKGRQAVLGVLNRHLDAVAALAPRAAA